MLRIAAGGNNLKPGELPSEGPGAHGVSQQLFPKLLKTIKHFYPGFLDSLRRMPDPRHPVFIDYEIHHVVMVGILMFVMRLGSRRQIRPQFGVAPVVANLNYLCQTGDPTVEHGDTVEYSARKLDLMGPEDVRYTMVYELIRGRKLEKGRLLGKYYLLAADGSGYLSFGEERHCAQCLTQTATIAGRERTYYYHPVMEFKLVTPWGLALSMWTEFIENPEGGQDKQDCEIKALQRGLPKIKKAFPQLPMCVLLDGLHAKEPVFDLLEDLDWRFLITFKEGSASAVYEEYEALRDLEGNRAQGEYRGVNQEFRWVEGVEWGKHRINVVECREPKKEGGIRNWVWVTDLKLTAENIDEIANRGARQRWRIENEGFNVQKNLGYNLGHAYSTDWHAAKVYYVLLQIAHNLVQIWETGMLEEEVRKRAGSSITLAGWLLEEFRREVPNPDELSEYLQHATRVSLAKEPSYPDSS